jgi:hypothetical protein
MFKFNFSDFKTKVILALAVLFVGTAAFAVSYYKEAVDLRENPQKVAQEEISDIVAQVSKHMLLPENETPTAATVADPDVLKKDQPFFNNAKTGDKVLIYASALKAILYNPESDKIVEVAPLSIGGR